MKITIDYKAKTIEVQDCENLSDMFEQVQLSLPHGEWRKYKLIDRKVEVKEYIYNNHNSGIVQPYIQPYQPYISSFTYQTTGTSSGNLDNITLTNGSNSASANNCIYNGQNRSEFLNSLNTNMLMGSNLVKVIESTCVNDLSMILTNQE